MASIQRFRFLFFIFAFIQVLKVIEDSLVEDGDDGVLVDESNTLISAIHNRETIVA